jgi:beta-N-acetylhexosaminidase
VQRFIQDFTPVPPMASFGGRAPEETERIHRQMAVELREVGVNFNFAPVADLSVPGAEGAIGDRSFGLDPVLVSEHVAAAVRGLTAEGVFGCAKHFPGHGGTTIDSRKDLPEVHLSREEVEGSLAPFRAAIAAGVPAVMTAHIIFPNAGDADWPASLSRYWISETLRVDMGFRELIVTDAIEMKSLSTRWTPEFCGEQALRAGADLLLYYKEAHQFRVFDELRGALQRGVLDVERVAESLDRVARLKRRLRANQEVA